MEEFITAHLGSSRSSIINDITTAMEVIADACTEAMEAYLVTLQQNKTDELKETGEAVSNRQESTSSQEELSNTAVPDETDNKESNKEDETIIPDSVVGKENEAKEAEGGVDEDIMFDTDNEVNQEAANTRTNDEQIRPMEPADQRPNDQAQIRTLLTLEDISIGSSQFESLIRHSVDKNSLILESSLNRDVFQVPQDLLTKGWIRLMDHKDMILQPEDVKTSNELDNELVQLLIQSKQESDLNRTLRKNIKEFKKIADFMKVLQESLHFLTTKPDDETIMESLQKVQPVNESLKYVAGHMERLFAKVEELRTEVKESSGKLDKPDEEKYIDRLVVNAIDGVFSIDHEATVGVLEEEEIETRYSSRASKRRKLSFDGNYQDVSALEQLLKKRR